MRPRKDGTSDEELATWGREYAEQVLGTYRLAPVWVLGLRLPTTLRGADIKVASSPRPGSASLL